MKHFFENLKEYMRLPEMRVFWLFLFLVLLILVVDAVYLTLLWTLVSAAILVAVGIVMFVTNIRAAATKVQLMNEKRRVDNIILSMNDGVMVYDADFKVQLFNRSAERIFGLAERDIVGQTITPESVRNPKLEILAKVIFQSLAPQVIRRSPEGEYPQVADLSFEEPHMELRVTTDRTLKEDGSVGGFLKIVRDRTHEVELVRAKSEFITVAAHQLRTPLSAINWTFQSLNDEKLTDSEKDLVNTGLSASTNLLKIVEDLLNTAKIEEGKFGYNFQTIDIVAFLQNLLNQAMVVAKEYNVKIYMERPPEAAMPVEMDAERMGLVVANLLENAIKYNVQNGQVVVSVQRRNDGPFVQVNIADTGLGMSKDTQEKIFTKFYRGDNVVTKEANGSGLGLYIAKNIIRRHGGQIWVESELNRGTTFHFTVATDPSVVPQREMAVEE